MNVRGLILLVVLGVPAALLLALGPREQQAIPADRVIVRYWEKWTGVERQAIERLVTRFNETLGAERGIWVDYNAVSNVDQRMLIATAGGDPPDLAGLFDYIVPQYAEQNAILPLDELVREYGIDVPAFEPIWLDICRYQGRLYALPSTPFTLALFYNRRLYAEAGLDPNHPPETTAELNEYALRLTKKDDAGQVTQLGFTVSPGMLGWWHWVYPCYFDARLWDGTQCHVDTPAGRAAFTWIADYRARVNNTEVLKFEATAGAIEGAQNPFLSERLTMVLQGPWVANWAAKYTPDLDYGVAPFPSVSRERRNVFASADVFVIPRGAKQPHEAMVFLAWLLQQPHLEELCQLHGKVSPFRTPGPDFFAAHPNPHIRVFAEMARSPDAFGYPSMPMWTEASAQLLAMLEDVLRGKSTVDAALPAGQARVDRIVADYQRKAARHRGGGS